MKNTSKRRKIVVHHNLINGCPTTMLDSLSIDLKALIERKNALESQLDNAKTLIDYGKQIKPVLDNLNSINAQVSEKHNTVNSFVDSAKDLLASISECENKGRKSISNTEMFQNDVERLKSDNEQINSQSKNLLRDLTDLQDKFTKQNQSIQEIIEDANRASMAGSFQKRKDELSGSRFYADIFTAISLLLLAVSSYCLFTNLFSQQSDLTITSLIIRVSCLFPLAWLSWFFSRRSSYLLRLEEEYGFKYSAAMAFEGYKKQVQEIDPEMEKSLLKQTIEQFGDKPTKIFEKDISPWPINDLNTLLSKVEKLSKDEKNNLIKVLQEKS